MKKQTLWQKNFDTWAHPSARCSYTTLYLSSRDNCICSSLAGQTLLSFWVKGLASETNAWGSHKMNPKITNRRQGSPKDFGLTWEERFINFTDSLHCNMTHHTCCAELYTSHNTELAQGFLNCHYYRICMCVSSWLQLSRGCILQTTSKQKINSELQIKVHSIFKDSWNSCPGRKWKPTSWYIKRALARRSTPEKDSLAKLSGK